MEFAFLAWRRLTLKQDVMALRLGRLPRYLRRVSFLASPSLWNLTAGTGRKTRYLTMYCHTPIDT